MQSSDDEEMAEAKEEQNLPPEGRVQEVRKQFSVHEDGALAYRIQNQEIEQHYGINRNNRRTVREDIPVARICQSHEEIEAQKERMRKLAALQAQAEADEIVARRINRQVQDEVRRDETIRVMEDEELAKLLQDKEKKKYEKYLEKKRERKLKKEREKLEQQLARTTEEARLALPQTNGSEVEQVSAEMEAVRIQGPAAAGPNGVTRYKCRITPAGRIEDDGDFSDFFAVPPDNLHPEEWEIMQQQQDEELARLLQEQEHKRSKAEVDRDKLREIELRDEQLAAIIQEQERLKEKKYKQKKQQIKEQQRLERQLSGQEGLPLGASANMLSQMSPDSPNADHNHHRYRRNSYTKSIDNGPAPVDLVSSPGGTPLTARSSRDRNNGLDDRPQMPPPQSEGQRYRTVVDVNQRTLSSQPPPRRQPGQATPAAELSPDDAPEVLRWLQAQGAPVVAPPMENDLIRGHRRASPSPHGSDFSDEELTGCVVRSAGHGPKPAGNFNIATAIDPTYNRQHHPVPDPHATQVKASIPVSRSLPLADGQIEWEPGVRGSLRRLRGTLGPYITPQDTQITSTTSQHDSSFEEGSQSGSFQPVQGQKRSTLDARSRKPRKQGSEAKSAKNSSCKQQ